MSVQKIRTVILNNVNVIGDNIVVAAIPQQLSPEGRILQQARKIYVIGGAFDADAAGDFQFHSGVGGTKTALMGGIGLAIGEKFIVPTVSDWEWAPFKTKPGEDLNMVLTAASSVDGYLLIAEVV